MSQKSIQRCCVVTNKKACPLTAEYKAQVKCSGCPTAHRDGVVYLCDDHLSAQVQDKVTCHRCKKINHVVSWVKGTQLPSTDSINLDTGASLAVKRRVGDRQRDEVISQLSDAFAGGFITRDEFEQRSSAVQSAMHAGDLAAVVSDREQLDSKPELPRALVNRGSVILGHPVSAFTAILLVTIAVTAIVALLIVFSLALLQA